MKTNTPYWWIANVPQDRKDKSKPQSHADFLREHLPRAAAKIGAQAGVIVCNPLDRGALSELKGIVIETSERIAPGNFWIGASNGNS